MAILESVTETPHCTAEFVKSDVSDRIGSVSHQAVYDGLRTLVDHGLLRRIQPSGLPARFEPRTEENHHHFICRSCNRMIDIEWKPEHAPCLEPSTPAGCEIHEAEVIYWGRCPDCRTNESTSKSRER